VAVDVIEGGRQPQPYRSAQTPEHGLIDHADRLTHNMGRWISAMGQKDAGSLDPTRRFRARPRDPFQLRPIVCFNRDIDDSPRCCHDAQP
jgi:hypothetical protein